MADNPPDSPIISNSLREELVEAFQNLLESENYVVEQTVPSDLCVDPEVFSHASFEEFAFKHTQFAKSLEEEAEKLMAKFPAGYKHHSIHMISNTINVSAVIGMSMLQFHKLFTVIYDDLKLLYPYCPMELKNDDHEAQTSVHYVRGCENKLKLFMCLYRLKTGCSFRHMEVIFGWAHNSIVEWFEVICLLLNRKLETYHVNIMDTLGPNWIQHQANIWKEKVVEEGKFEHFQRRFVDHNRKDKKKKIMIPSDDEETFMGSIGAVDGTYTLRCRVSRKRYSEAGHDPSKDIMYSDFIKQHAWKLSVITSHSIGPYQQLLLNVSVHPANVSDTAAYSFGQMPEFRKYIPLGCCLLGDMAYLDDFFVLPPYPTQSINIAKSDDRVFMASYNHEHSSYRSCAEHGIAFLKQWGIVRGRSDLDQFSSDDWYKCCLQICWGLHNFFVLTSRLS